MFSCVPQPLWGGLLFLKWEVYALAGVLSS